MIYHVTTLGEVEPPVFTTKTVTHAAKVKPITVTVSRSTCVHGYTLSQTCPRCPAVIL